MLNKIQNNAMIDTTNDDSGNAAQYIIISGKHRANKRFSKNTYLKPIAQPS
ncbi:MAG TPA: hypothetical protein VNT20_11495 [Flavisolibacter sp.]|jgi:hypothetical protein|nr:hypothetical protein [Flavisolibacter sp.]